MKNSVRLLAAASVSLLAVATASAADLPSRRMAPVAAPVAFVPAFTWTGFYVGLQGGYQWATTKGTSTTVPVTAGYPYNYSYDSNGWMFGGHVGYNYQINQFVIGVEGDIEWADVNSTRLNAATATFNRTNIDWQASLRARVGVAFDRALIYATAGAAYANVNYAFGNTIAGVPVAPAVLSYGRDKWGWTVGAGVEYAFTNNLTGRIEYRYTDYGRINAVTVPAAVVDNSKLTVHAVRAGISYKF